MTQWHSIHFFWLFVAWVLLVGWLYRRRRVKPGLKFSNTVGLKKTSRGVRGRLAFLPKVLQLMAMALMIVALARPEQSNQLVRRHTEGIDIVIALDISDSMLIEDMRPAANRLEASKNTISEFIQGRSSDRIGLVVFSGESYTRVPLTLDYPLLLKSLSEVSTTRSIKMGTAIGVALANAVTRLQDSKAKTKSIIFLTDGESNSGTVDPETALDIAVQNGVKIYSIGMGVDGQARLPLHSQAGGRKYYRPIHSTINEKLLTQMATRTGGRFWRATNHKNLKQIFKTIDELEKTKIESTQYTQKAQLFQPWVWWAFLLYALGLLLGHSLLRVNV